MFKLSYAPETRDLEILIKALDLAVDKMVRNGIIIEDDTDEPAIIPSAEYFIEKAKNKKEGTK